VAEPVYSVLQVLPQLEATIREYFPRMAFYVGEDELTRDAQPPKIIWEIDGGDPTGIVPTAPADGLADPRPFASDWIIITAICTGASTPVPVATEKAVRAQEYATSEAIMCVLRWALKRSTAAGWLGAHEWLGWKTVWPAGPQDRGCPIECTFRVRMTYLAPARPIAEPPLTQEFFPVTLVTS